MIKPGLLNVRSLSNKSMVIYGVLFHNKVDVMVLTESWHRSSDGDSVKSALPPVYRPGSRVAYKLFFDELAHVVEGLTVSNIPLLMAGDFNIHLEDVDDLNARRMEGIFTTFDVARFVHDATHIGDGMLDFVAASSGYGVTDVNVRTPGKLSDHALVTCILSIKKVKAKISSYVVVRGMTKLHFKIF
ncbi:hypothetical protein HELRODRAFT_169136 [Helobdella robusta]|uniref:Endonuclease/exonuclease/phosphatase domain-containing protein n=1 Tax=Helobdella robusta TaxID=6412 RepID=T1F1G1_HELRO|nr:hypothetical protein HELRODRAFT_169136 [Helobdella robusta]ESO08327.1 hypothetical protein HELRODRAFT_169136 [Helobdella robusta]